MSTDRYQTRHNVATTQKNQQYQTQTVLYIPQLKYQNHKGKTQRKYKESNPQKLHGQKTKFMNIYQKILPTLYNQMYLILVNLCMQPQRMKKSI